MTEEAHQYVEQRVVDAAEEIEEAIIACENPDERGELVGILRLLINTQLRHHDDE